MAAGAGQTPELLEPQPGAEGLLVPVGSAFCEAGLPRQADARLGGDRLILAGAALDS